MGTPDFAARVLAAVLDSGLTRVVGVYTQPDRPCGRGQSCRPSAVKLLALERGLPVHQPVNFKDAAERDSLAALAPDVLLVAAYGLILPQSVLDIPRLMPLNVHASLLPKYRGAAPIQRAILNGEHRTGVTIMRMEAGLDSGPMLLASAVDIAPDETAGELQDRLAVLGGDLLARALSGLGEGTFPATPQDDAQATQAPKIDKAEARIRFDRPAREVHDRIRAMTPKPGPFFTLDLSPGGPQIRLVIAPGAIGRPVPHNTPPGRILGLVSDKLAIACLDFEYLIPALRPAGKNFMNARSFACGYLNKLGPDAIADCTPSPERPI